MAKRGEITKRSVDAMKPKATKDVFLWDGKLSGFGVRCRPSTERYYFIKMRHGKRQRWITIGKHGSPWTPDTARSEALRLLGKREEGTDPGAERDRLKENPTVDELAKAFLEEHADAKKKPRTAAEYRRLYDKLVSPKLGETQVCAITQDDIESLHFRLRTTPYQANRVLSLISKLFTWAIRKGKVNSNPARGIERYTEHKRKLFLNGEELSKIGTAMREMEKAGNLEPQEAAAIRLLLFTGCRLNEILTLQWEHVDKTNAVLRLPDSKTGAKLVPLSAPALTVLSELPRIKGNPFVIPSPRFKKRHLINLEKPWLLVRKKAGLEKARLHDLRHAYGSMAAGVGFGLPIIGAILGHHQASTTQRYAHVQNDPMKAAADAIASRLQEALDKEQTG